LIEVEENRNAYTGTLRTFIHSTTEKKKKRKEIITLMYSIEL